MNILRRMYETSVDGEDVDVLRRPDFDISLVNDFYFLYNSIFSYYSRNELKKNFHKRSIVSFLLVDNL